MVPIWNTLDAILDFATIPFDGMSCERSFRQKECFPLTHFVRLDAILMIVGVFLVTFDTILEQSGANLDHFGVALGAIFRFLQLFLLTE